MSWIDIYPLVLIAVFAIGGYFSGFIRRAIGLAALFVACWGATNMGLQAGGILQQSSSYETPDARIYGFFGIMAAILLIVEVGTQIAHKQIQIPAIVLNRTLGVILGVVTAVMLSIVSVYELEQAANPVGGSQLTGLELHIKDAVDHSLYMVKLVDTIGKPVIALFQPVLPTDPQIYFGPGPVA